MATYLTSNTGTATNAKKFTYSVWLKRSAIDSSASQRFYQGYKDANNRFYAYFVEGADSNEDRLWIYAVTGGTVEVYWVSNRRFRDTNAWYHIVFSADSTQASQGDRFKVYVNGVEETSWTKTNNPSQNIDWGNQLAQTNGDLTISGTESQTQPFLGLMSHINFIDGTAYDASAFGSTDATTGEWKINTSPSVTYGNNGYFILKDGNTITDSSPNSNNFTLASGTLTKTEDNPSNVFATGNTLIGRHSNGNYLQPDWSNGNLTATAHGSAWRIFKSTLAASSGKYYAEFKWVSDSNTRYAYVGIYDEDNYANKVSGYPYMGDMANCHAYYSENGQYYGQGNGNSVSFGSAFSSTGDGIVGVAMDLDNSKVYFSSNGSWQGSGDPSNGTGGKSITANKLYSFALQLYSVGSIVYSANFGNGYFGTTAVSSAGTNASGIGIFEYDVPTGYTALSTKGLNL